MQVGLLDSVTSPSELRHSRQKAAVNFLINETLEPFAKIPEFKYFVARVV